MSLSCLDVTALLEFAKYANGWTTNDQLCTSVNGFLNNDLNDSKKNHELVKIVEDWYKEHFAPCLESTCSATSAPVDKQEIQQVPRRFIEGVLYDKLEGWQAFVLDNWQLVAVVVVVLLSFGGFVGFLLGRSHGRS